MSVPGSIFKANDIRGIYGDTLTDDGARLIGRALAAEGLAAGAARIALARDGRLSSPALAAALVTGLREGGLSVLDLGLAPTPALYYTAFAHCGGSGVMLTGSHNPPAHNGMKMLIGGQTLKGDGVQSLARRIAANDFGNGGAGSVSQVAMLEEYINAVAAASLPPSRSLHLVVDAGNGAAGVCAQALYEKAGHRVTALYCEPDGNFPHHHPDPAQPENLVDAREEMRRVGADAAFVFDGDGDRLGVLLPPPEDWVFPDRVLMLLAQDLLRRHPGTPVVFDVKCTGRLAPWIEHHGGVADMQPTGHAFIKSQMKKTGALLGGEMSGHFYFADNWAGFDDALLAGVRLAAILADNPQAMAEIPQSVASPEIVLPLSGRDGHNLIEEMRARANFDGAERIITIDGLRVEYADGFGLARASNTTASLVLRFEGEDEAAMTRIRRHFQQALALVGVQF